MEYSKSKVDTEGDVENSDVDITQITSEKSGNQIVFTMEVLGDIKESVENEDYNYMVYVTEVKSEDEMIYVSYSDGEATWVDYTGDSMDSGPADYSISGGTLEMRVTQSIFSNLKEFHFWATAAYSNSETGEQSIDYLHSWDGSETDGDLVEEILDRIWFGSMLCIALGVIIPLIVIVLIIFIVIKLTGEEEKEQPPPSQQQQQPSPPPRDISEQPPPPPDEDGSQES